MRINTLIITNGEVYKYIILVMVSVRNYFNSESIQLKFRNYSIAQITLVVLALRSYSFC